MRGAPVRDGVREGNEPGRSNAYPYVYAPCTCGVRTYCKCGRRQGKNNSKKLCIKFLKMAGLRHTNFCDTNSVKKFLSGQI